MTLLNLPACPFTNDVHTQRAGEFYHTYEFEIPSTHPSARFAVEGGNVLFPDLDGKTKVFSVTNVEFGSMVRVSSEDSAQYDLNADVMVPTGTNPVLGAVAMATLILQGSRWRLGTCEADPNTEWELPIDEYPSKWESLQAMATHWGVEIVTEPVVYGNQIVDRIIHLVRAQGQNRGVILRYGGNTDEMTRRGNGGYLYTALYGFGSGENISSVVWVKANGDPMDKPAGELLLKDEEARLKWGIELDDGTKAHRVGVFRCDETEPGAILWKTYQELLVARNPRYNYECSIAALERPPAQRPGDPKRTWEAVRAGDFVTVDDIRAGYRDLVRVIEIRRSYSDPSQDSVTLGVPEVRLADYIRQSVLLRRSSW
jgi:hypothetical protein